MFKCDKCGVVSAPRLSPTLVSKSEVAEYSYKDAEGEPQASVGNQIVWEKKWCHSCAGIPVPVQDDGGSAVVNHRGAQAAFNHLRRCNKKAEDCRICAQIQMFFSLLPLHHLSEALVEVPATPATFSFGTMIMDSTFERGTHRSQRGLRDKAAGMMLLKYYEEEGGRLGAGTH